MRNIVILWNFRKFDYFYIFIFPAFSNTSITTALITFVYTKTVMCVLQKSNNVKLYKRSACQFPF